MFFLFSEIYLSMNFHTDSETFFSEMYLYIFHNSSENIGRLYTIPYINCFKNIYKTIFNRIDIPIPMWNVVIIM